MNDYVVSNDSNHYSCKYSSYIYSVFKEHILLQGIVQMDSGPSIPYIKHILIDSLIYVYFML